MFGAKNKDVAAADTSVNHNDDQQIVAVLNAVAPLFKDNADALHYIMCLYAITQIWDDLVDGDRQRTSDDINRMLRIALIDLNENAFFIRYRDKLVPLMLSAILQWQDANVLEKSDVVEDLVRAYSLRVSWHQIIAYCCDLIGGPSYSREVGPAVRRLYDETWEGFQQEMKERKK